MNEQKIRRATLDDLAELRKLWMKARLDNALLEKHLTEFQVIDSNGLAACIGIRVASQQGLVHSEALANFTQRDQLSPILWDRIQTIARNHGLHRLWMDDPDPTWICRKFKLPLPEQLKKLPPAFGAGKEWHVLQLKDESIATLSLEQEFDLFTQAQKQSTEETLRKARVLKRFAYGLLSVVVAALVALLLFTLRHPAPNHSLRPLRPAGADRR